MLKYLKLKTKLLMVLSFPIIAFLITLFLGVQNIKTISKELSYILYEQNDVASNLILNADRDFYQSLLALKEILVDNAKKEKITSLMGEYQENISQVEERVVKAKEIIEKGNLNVQSKEYFLDFETHIDKWKRQIGVFSSLVLSNPNDHMALVSNLEKGMEHFEKAREDLNKIGEIIEESSKKSVESTKKEVQNLILNMLMIGIFLIIVGIIVGLSIIRKISSTIKQIADISSHIAKGELNVENISISSYDEIGHLSGSINQMKENLKDIIHELHHTSSQVASTSNELSASTEQTTQANEQIVISIQHLVEGFETQKQKTVENHNEVEEMACIIDAGNQAIQHSIKQISSIHHSVQSSNTMIKRLGERSNEVGNIVELITDIAEQTNLLALNAAIEAARAGEAGKGFAVVADEVRKLAEQSETSSKEIVSLIKQIQQDTTKTISSMEKGIHEVEKGLEVVNQAGKSFGEIMNSVNNTKQQINDVLEITIQSNSHLQQISASSQEQLSTLEEISNSSRSLSKRADELDLLMKKFEI